MNNTKFDKLRFGVYFPKQSSPYKYFNSMRDESNPYAFDVIWSTLFEEDLASLVVIDLVENSLDKLRVHVRQSLLARERWARFSSDFKESRLTISHGQRERVHESSKPSVADSNIPKRRFSQICWL